MPERIQLSRVKGWRMPPDTVKVDRTTRFGNPFNLSRSEHCWTAIAHGFKGDKAGRLAASIFMFRAWLARGKAAEVSGCGLYIESPKGSIPVECTVAPPISAPVPPTADDIASLRGKNLACWCKPGTPCHADVLLELANA